MVYAAYLANQIGYLARDAVDLHLQLLRFFDLPVKLSELTDRKTTASELLSIMQLDKKSSHLVLLHGLHKAELVHIKKMKDEIVQLLEKQLG
jgi:3-dehydroquinate synthetase